MNISITIKNPSGNIKAISSKSYAHRHLICSALSDKPNYLRINETSQDIDATINCLNALGSNIIKDNEGITVNPIKKVIKNAFLDCNESGSTFRFMLPLVCALNSDSAFLMKEGLARRPITQLYSQLNKKGCTMSKEGSIPFYVKGQMSSGDFLLPGDVSSQYITGLMLALPVLKGKSRITLTSQLESSGYVDMTTDVLSKYSIETEKNNNSYIIPGNQRFISPSSVIIEKDWSNAAFFLCAGALSEEGITVEELDLNSYQKDKHILDILERMGASISYGIQSITIKKKDLIATDIDACEIPDLVPVLSLVASLSKGTTNIYNAKRLRIKESDRISSICDMLKRLGADIDQKDDSLVITGRPLLKGGTINSFNDHRIAMSASIASISCEEPVVINDAQAVNKSYPAFYDDIKKIGGNVIVM